MDTSNPARRRGVGFVTSNACTECRRKRTKCDGQNPCSRCKSLGYDLCNYELPTRQTKEEMREEIAQLRSRQQQIDEFLATLASRDDSKEALNQLREGRSLEAIKDRLQGFSSPSEPTSNITMYPRAGDHQAISHALESAQNAGNVYMSQPFASTWQQPSQHHFQGQSEPWVNWSGEDVMLSQGLNENHQLDTMNWTTDSVLPITVNQPAVGVWHDHPADPESNSAIQSARSHGQDVILGSRTGFENSAAGYNADFSIASWTTVTSDNELIEHLTALYFCWEYPIFASLSKEHFMPNFRNGNSRYCSSLLVNALLALACRFSDRPAARATPDDDTTTGDHFFAEALRLFNEEDDHRVLTTIQALGIMSIREASCGRLKESIFFSGQSIRLAVEMGLHLVAEHEEEEHNNEAEEFDEAARQATFWGAFSLDEALSLCTGSVPQFSRNAKLQIKPSIIRHVESASWIPYTDDGGPLEQNCVQPSNIRSVYKTFCELSEIIHSTLYTVYTPGTIVTSEILLDKYRRYIHWYDSIPDALRLGHNFTPSVLFSHLYYHFSILLLFRPFIEYSIIGSDVSPRDICDQASLAISAIIRSYSKLYTLRRTPSLVPYFVLSSTAFRLTEVHKDTSSIPQMDRLIQDMTDLKEMSTCHGFATRALDIVRFLGHKWEVDNTFLGKHEEDDAEKLSIDSLKTMEQLGPIVGDLANVQKVEDQPLGAASVSGKGQNSAPGNSDMNKRGFLALS